MEIFVKIATVTGALAFSLLVSPPVLSQSRNTPKEEAPTLGTHIRQSVSTASIPLRKPYDRFTDDEKDLVRSQYEPSTVLQHPPFPKKSLGASLLQLRKISENLGQEGELEMVFAVDAKGVAQRVQVVKTPSRDFARHAAAIVMATPFKAASCGGQPCEMEFPLRLVFVLD